jgi:hypothetical protein
MTFSDYDEPPQVASPPASETVDIVKLNGR